MKQRIIAANWKLNKTIREALDFVTRLKRETFSLQEAVTIVVCPPFTALSEVAEILGDSPIKLGAQDLYWEDAGAFTGEVSAPLLKDAGCTHVIIGHSERRQFFFETNQTVNRKIKSALRGTLVPIVCCGERLEERDASKTLEVLKVQITEAFQGISSEEAVRCAIAYEPVWAIGTGRIATPAEAQEAQAFIRGLLSQGYSLEASQRIPILYGGSVKPENSIEVLRQPDVDGALVGGASLQIDSFINLVRSLEAAKV